MAALAAGAATAGAAGCGGSPARPPALRLERADIVLVAHTLQHLQSTTRGEVAAARALWPALASGLPRGLSPTMRVELAAAERYSARLALPTVITTEGGLTGPAAKLGGMLKAYAGLTKRGWRYTASALATQSLRPNAALYLYSIYDGHYDLSLIGKSLQSAFRKLGGAPAFGGSLTQAEVEALARAYSIAATRLVPHPPASLVV